MSHNPLLIFHSPLPIALDPISGSAVRPAAMLRAFQCLGIEVEVIDGSSRQRRDEWAATMSSGREIFGVYSELSTLPIALADPDRVPRAPFHDFRQFARLRNIGVPVSAFYRDVYWRFSSFPRRLPIYKRPALAFYRLEAWQITRHVDHVFLPSMRMKDYIPFVRKSSGVSALPPGGRLRQITRSVKAEQPLRLFYVGGVGGEQYDINPMLRAIEAMGGVRLTLCCREADWLKVRARYGKLRNVEVVHHSGAQLDQHYHEADAFIMWWEMVRYLRFAMPVKLGEAIGWGLPVITNADCAMGDTVERGGLGWAVRTEDDLVALLKRLRDDREAVAVKQAEVMRVREQHSWEARAQTVLSTLKAYRTRHERLAYRDALATVLPAEDAFSNSQ